MGDVTTSSKMELDSDLEQCLKDWTDLSNEYADLEELHVKYKSKLEETLSLQKKCQSSINHQKYRLKAIQKLSSHVNVETDDPISNEELQDLNKGILKRYEQLNQMEQHLPKESGKYLKLILGNVNVSILDQKTRYDYKDQYEQFKLILNIIGFFLSVLCIYFQHRILDVVFIFLILWYYCTLTIRESILRVNGSRIRVSIHICLKSKKWLQNESKISKGFKPLK